MNATNTIKILVQVSRDTTVNNGEEVPATSSLEWNKSVETAKEKNGESENGEW